jgi:hypothetical protein
MERVRELRAHLRALERRRAHVVEEADRERREEQQLAERAVSDDAGERRVRPDALAEDARVVRERRDDEDRVRAHERAPREAHRPVLEQRGDGAVAACKPVQDQRPDVEVARHPEDAPARLDVHHKTREDRPVERAAARAQVRREEVPRERLVLVMVQRLAEAGDRVRLGRDRREYDGGGAGLAREAPDHRLVEREEDRASLVCGLVPGERAGEA